MVGWWLVNVINIVSKWGVVMINGIVVILGAFLQLIWVLG